MDIEVDVDEVEVVVVVVGAKKNRQKLFYEMITFFRNQLLE